VGCEGVRRIFCGEFAGEEGVAGSEFERTCAADSVEPVVLQILETFSDVTSRKRAFAMLSLALAGDAE